MAPGDRYLTDLPPPSGLGSMSPAMAALIRRDPMLAYGPIGETKTRPIFSGRLWVIPEPRSATGIANRLSAYCLSGNLWRIANDRVR
jgi:hypothetical protein